MDTGKLVASIALRLAAGIALVGGIMIGLDYLGIVEAACRLLRFVPVMD